MRKGSKMTIEQRKRLSDAHKGHVHSQEARQKMSLAMSGENNPNYGKKIPNEQRLKISSSLQGRKMPWVSKSNSVRVWSDETRQKRSLVSKKMWTNPEYVAKMSRKGIDNPCYIKDRSKVRTYEDRRSDANYKIWVQSVISRDIYRCKIDNSDCCGRLEAHHILSWRKHPKLRYELSNGITLCQFHHPHWRMEEEKISLFQELIVSQISSSVRKMDSSPLNTERLDIIK